jgi:4-hydroxy-4-methyl-2-oxoglutarate aldolase
MRHAGKKDPGTIGESITLAGRHVATGDIVVADTDGVVIVPQASVDTALVNAEARAEKERLRIESIRNGEVPPMTADPTS